MRIRRQKIEDAAELARLHRATIRHINSKDYPEDIIKVWSARTNAKRFRNYLDLIKSQCLNVQVSSFGKNPKEALKNLEEALDLYFEAIKTPKVTKIMKVQIISGSLKHA